jgi:hypothetical protein
MVKQGGRARRLCAAGAVAALLGAGCAATEPRIERYRPVLPGSTFTMSVTSTGSYGSGTSQVTTTIGQRHWEGRTVIAQESPAGAMLLDPANGTRLGFVGPDGQTQWTLDPPVGLRYPMQVGQGWVAESTLTLTGPQGKRALPVRSEWKVEAVEEVSVPAGTFKALRVSVSDTMGGQPWNADTYWIEPAQEFTVKVRLRRLPTHPAGAGSRESLLVSKSIRR